MVLCFHGDVIVHLIRATPVHFQGTLPVACFLSFNGSFARAHAIEASDILGRGPSSP